MRLPTKWLAVVGTSLFFSAFGALPPSPGVLNYLEGHASLAGRELSSSAVGESALTAGQVLRTEHGKAEVLLIPGVFLRLNDNSAVRMISPSLTNTQLEVLRGQALVEASDIQKENNVRVLDRGASITLVKNGVYAFDADQPAVRVFDGKAAVVQGDKKVELKKGHMSMLTAGLVDQKFDRDEAKDDLYKWSSVRSKYLSEASMASARAYGEPLGWYGPRWYWNPWFHTYSYLPGDGFLYSPFGFGFYSPRYFYRPPVVVYRPRIVTPRVAPRFHGSARGMRR